MLAVLLAGGKGTRLRPYTISLPKPLMPIGDHPILEIMIRQLKSAGVRRFVIAVGYLESVIRAYFGDGSKWEVEIEYSSEVEPLGTAGPLQLIRENLNDTFFFMNGDTFSDWDFLAMTRSHKGSGAVATIGVTKRTVDIDFGVVEVDRNGRFSHWKEKPTVEHLVSSGIYVLEPKVLEYLPSGFYNIPELIQDLHKKGNRINCYEHHGYWLDIGRIDDYRKACELVHDD